MERATKLVTFFSMVLAVGAASWLASAGWPAVWPLTLAVFVATASIAWFTDERAAAVALLFAYVFPALIILTHGRFSAEYGVVWMAAILAAIGPRTVRSGWAVPLRWKAPLILWALTVALSWPIVVLREFDFVAITLTEPRLASSVAGSFPHEAAIGVLNVATTLGIGILWFDWLFLAFAADLAGFRRWVVGALAASWLVAVVVAGYQIIGDLQFLTTGIFGTMGRATSTMGDANAFGMVAAICGAVVVAWLLSGDRPRYGWPLIGAVLLSWIGVWASGSRTAFAAGVIVLASLLWGARSGSQHAPEVWKAGLAAVVGAIVVLVVLGAAMRLPVVGPMERLRASLPSPDAGSVSEFLKEMWNRNNYGATATIMIRQHPLVGVGAGGFAILVPDYSGSVGSPFILPRDNAQNWYRHQLAEFGLLGSLGWILWTVSFGWFVLVSVTASSERPSFAVLKGAIVALALVSLVGMPTQNTAVALTFWTIAFWVGSLGGVRDPSDLRPATMGKHRWLGIVAVLCLFLAGTAYAARHDLRVARRAARADWRYNYGFYEPEQTAEGRAFRWAQKQAVIALPVEAPWMRLTVSVNHSDLARNPVDVRVWVADGLVIDTTLGTSTPAIRYVRMPESEQRVVVETWVSRVMRPRDYGAADPRDLGLIVQWEFVDSPP